VKLANDYLAGGLVFAAALAVFWFSPVRQVTDSKYSMLLSQSLLYYRSFALDNYAVPRLPPTQREDYVMDGDIYQLELVGNHVYYFFPPGSSVLSLPYVAAANALGVRASNPDGTYDQRGEIAIETGLASVLMAALTFFFFRTARLLLPLGWGVVVALGGALGTQVWSTASRGLWSHTWGILLLGAVIHVLLAAEAGKTRLRPELLATLLAWTYFVRPSNSVFIIAVSVYILVCYRHLFVRYAAAGALWLGVLAAYSWYHFRAVLPNYYRASRMKFDAFLVAFPGNILSPSRGLLVYVPVLLFIFYLLARYRREWPHARLVRLALATVAADLIIVSGFPHWWGGASFGPRLMTDAVPWLVLLAVLALRAMLDWRAKHAQEISRYGWGAQQASGALLLALSVFINARGALSVETWKWNEEPKDVVLVQRKLWDWRQPQFLAGLIRPPLDREYPLIEGKTRIDFTSRDADKYLWYGWSGPEPNLRWSEAREAAMVFALKDVRDVAWRAHLAPFVVRGASERQRVYLELNGRRVETFLMDESRDYDLSVNLPRAMLRRENVLTVRLPDAASPEDLKLSLDVRRLGIAVYWMEFEPQTLKQ
jgi:hypothetical protein